MKVAIYSRVVDLSYRAEMQHFFDELFRQRIAPVIFQPFFAAIAAGLSRLLPYLTDSPIVGL